ncbi:MAG: IS982 family transposase, partial [Pseudanabaena sp. M065S1SP2A07QC]|nr:IS982 family transposase [Pseudanabaena sp. M065S1SP2A07QC]
MNDEIVAIYCLCDDILRAMNHKSDIQQQMSDAEVMTTA